jgi:hypothetical protein
MILVIKAIAAYLICWVLAMRLDTGEWPVVE